jgi:hypothetical protein
MKMLLYFLSLAQLSTVIVGQPPCSGMRQRNFDFYSLLIDLHIFATEPKLRWYEIFIFCVIQIAVKNALYYF